MLRSERKTIRVFLKLSFDFELSLHCFDRHRHNSFRKIKPHIMFMPPRETYDCFDYSLMANFDHIFENNVSIHDKYTLCIFS